MQLSKTAKILIATGTTLITGALFFPKKSKAASLPQHTSSAQNMSSSGGSTPSSAKIITNHDGAYDYKNENGRWYTRRKGTNAWTDMQTALSPRAYQLAVSRLQKYI